MIIFNFNDSKESGFLVKNTVSDMNLWNFHDRFHKKLTDEQIMLYRKWFDEEMPYLKRVQFMTATGGSEKRDLFKDPLVRNVLDDYDFSPLINAVDNLKHLSLTPMIITGNVPLKFCKEPRISKAFGVNMCPPDDYTVYHQYIKTMTQSIVQAVGIDYARKITWGVLTEYENKDWFSVDDDPIKTRDAYIKLYDCTCDAITSVLGEEHTYIGAHSMTVAEGLWDEREFIKHCASGINTWNGKTGARLCFLTASFYDFKPGQLSETTLKDSINLLRDCALENGLSESLEYGVDEGRLLMGPDGKELTSRVLAHSYQGSYDAKLIKETLDNKIDWFASWEPSTQALFGGISTVGMHVAKLFYNMVGLKRLDLDIIKTSCEEQSCVTQLDGFGGISSDKKKLVFLIYNHSESLDCQEKTNIRVNINIESKIKTVMAKTAVIGDNNGNFWSEWWKDQNEFGITDDDYNWSRYSVQVAQGASLQGKKNIDFWHSNESKYKKLSEVKFTSQNIEIKDNMLSMDFELSCHEVLYIEIDGE